MSASNEPVVHPIFDPNTSTWTYLIADPATKSAIIIDSVLDFDPSKNAISTTTADSLLLLIEEKGYTVSKVLETHAHADHLTASKYLQSKLKHTEGDKNLPEICIGKRIIEVQERFGQRYGIPREEYEGVFDHLFDDGETFQIGQLEAKAIHLPGHTPDHMGYLIGCECNSYSQSVGP